MLRIDLKNSSRLFRGDLGEVADLGRKLCVNISADVTRQDVETLRENGFDDRAILDIVQIVAYFAFANRLTDGLGIALED